MKPPKLPSMRRNRLGYALAATVVVALGLLWRSSLFTLPTFISKYGGDALWALLIFLCLGCIFPRKSTFWIGAISLGLAWSIEFLQLYHGSWIDGIRSTRLGRMVLGTTFNAPDLLAYALGIGFGVLIERPANKPVPRSN